MYNPNWTQTNYDNFGMYNQQPNYDGFGSDDSDEDSDDEYGYQNLDFDFNSNLGGYKGPANFVMPDFSNAQVAKPHSTYTINNPVVHHTSGSSSVSSSSTSSSTSSGSTSRSGSGSSTTTTTVTKEPSWLDRFFADQKEKKAQREAAAKKAQEEDGSDDEEEGIPQFVDQDEEDQEQVFDFHLGEDAYDDDEDLDEQI